MRFQGWRGPRIALGVALVVHMFPGARAGGQTPADVSVQRTGPARITADPGARITLSFMLRNTGTAERVAATFVGLPPTWQLIIPDSAMSLAPRAAELQLIPVAVPSGARAGEYRLHYSATVGGTTASDSVWVTVVERRQVSVAFTSAPNIVPAGQSYTASFLVRNAGNAPATIRLELSGNRGVSSRLDSSVVQLDPGCYRTVSATIRTDAGATHKVVHHIGVVAKVVSDTSAYATAVSTVEVVPMRSAKPSGRYGLPAHLVLGRADRDRSVTPELRGTGYLTPAQATQMDFVLRAPSPGGFLGQADEYWVRFGQEDRFRLQLGDQFFSGSSIMRRVRPGIGASAEATFGKGLLIVGAQGQRDRRSFGRTNEQEYGGTLDSRLFTDRARVGVGFLSRSGIAAGDFWMTRGAIHPFARRAAGNALRWEYGRGVGADGASGVSYLVSMSASVRRFSLGLRREAADSAFPGVDAGLTYSSATARLTLPRRIALFGNAMENLRRAVGPFSSGPGLRMHREAEGGVELGRFLGLAYRLTRDTGNAFPRTAGRTGQSGRAFVTLPVLGILLQGSAERGTSVFDDQPGVSVPFTRIRGRTGVTLWGQTFDATVDRLYGMQIYSFSRADELNTQLTTGFKIAASTRLNATVSSIRYNGPFPRTFTMLDIGLGQQLPMGHRALVRSRSLAYGGTGSANMQSMQHAEYTVPFSLPLLASEPAGNVNVRILDGRGRPMSGLLVRLGGDARITDALGQAKFTRLTPGSVYLDLDRSRWGPGRIIAPVVPMAVEVQAGETHPVELRITESAQLSGAVQLLEFAPNRPLNAPDSLVDAGGATGVRLQLTNNGDTLRTVSNGGGRFRFGDVRPGRWVLTVLPADLPPQHRAEQERVELELRAGDAPELSLRLLPVRRSVQFIAEAELTPALPEAAVPARYHVVRNADVSLMQVARAAYGDAALWAKIWVANRALLPRPEAIRVGQRLAVPAKAPLTAEEIAARDEYMARVRAEPAGWPRADASWRPPVVRHRYTVTRHDKSLMHIARVMYDDASLWPKIWLANLDMLRSPDGLRPGQRLRVPDEGPLTDAERAARDAYYERQRQLR